MIEIVNTTATTEQVRAVAVVLHQNRDKIPTYNHGSSKAAPHWAPIAHCAGPERWALYTPAIPVDVANLVAQAMEAHAPDDQRTAS